MATKTILIKLTEPDLTLPEHLQKPMDISIDMQGFGALDAMNVLNAVQSQLLKEITLQLTKQNTNQLKKTN